MPEETKAAPPLVGWKQSLLKLWKKTPVVFKAVASILIALNAFFALYSRFAPSSEGRPKEKASVSSQRISSPVSKTAHPALPDNPSIAVLPFVNMSGDKEQEYFSDGLAEEIIDAISKLRDVFVISRNSSFAYKGKDVKVQQIAEELGVQYILEGSVRKTADKVRVTARLVDALTGRELMSERYDRDLKDIFALQDELTMNVLTAMRVALEPGVVTRDKGTKSLAAYLKVMQATPLAYSRNERDAAIAKRLAEEAIALDPNYARPYAVMARAISAEIRVGKYKDPKHAIQRIDQLARKAVALDDSSTAGHVASYIARLYERDYDGAKSESQRIIDLEPGGAAGFEFLGVSLSWNGQYAEAVPVLQKCLRLSPGYVPCLAQLGVSYLFLGKYEEAIAVFKDVLQREPDRLTTHLNLTAAYVLAGKEPEAHAQATEVLKINPNFSLQRYADAHLLKNRADLLARVIEPLREAGLK